MNRAGALRLWLAAAGAAAVMVVAAASDAAATTEAPAAAQAAEQPAKRTASQTERQTVVRIGRDVAGRPCEARRIWGDPLAARRGERSYDLVCGRSGGVGRIYVLEEAADALARWRAASAGRCASPRDQVWRPGGLTVAASTVCAGETAGADGRLGRPALVLLAGVVGGRLYAGEAGLATAQALEAALEILSGAASEPATDAPAGPRSALLESLEAALGQDLSGGGFADFQTLRRAAFENNALWLFGAAELQFSDAIRMHASLWPQDLAGRADLQSERGLNLSNQRRFAEAEVALAQAQSAAEQSADGFMIAKTLAYQALAAFNRGDEATLLTTGAKAEAALAEWLASPAAATSVVDQASGLLPAPMRAIMLDAQIARARGLALQKAGQTEAARSQFLRAGASAARLDDRAASWLQAGIAQDRAALEARDGRLAEAAAILENALGAYRKVAQRTRVEANILMDLAEIERRRGREDAAFARFGDAFAIYREQPENRGVSATRGLPYLEALAAQVRRGDPQADPNRLFDAFETLASPAVAQTAAATAARLMAGDGGGVIRAFQDGDRRLRRSLARLSALSPEAEPLDRLTAESEVARARDQLVLLQAEMDRAFPNYGVVTLAPIRLHDLQAALGPGETVLRIALGLERGVGLMIDRDSVTPFAIAVGERAATDLVNRIKGSVRNRDMEFDAQAAQALFEALFGELRQPLMATQQRRRLIIEATGALASLPFGVLLTDDDPESWLATRKSLVSVASLKAFTATRQAGASRAERAFAGFGDFLPIAGAGGQNSAAGESLARRIVTARGLPEQCIPRLQAVLARLPPLPGTAQELTSVRAVTGAPEDAIYLRERFTDQTVTGSQTARGARVVMFSTHGVFAADYPDARDCLPDAALLTSAADGVDNLFLDSARVLELRLDADLVVLSACDTGNPEPIAPGETGLPSGGDALSGLARAFFYAGARSVMISHWVLPDEDTVPLIEELFRALQEGLAAPEALQRAQMAQIARGADDPLQWAAFALVGAPPAL